ncbi:synergin gamma [Elysia marginata]|uniref:Synergin gamma n=1 Tax=Elysia marginata TaxID=1093978 RepID=A0AAV4HLC8_9GAST|nr:synergin gamma [Elysia marginata]
MGIPQQGIGGVPGYMPYNQQMMMMPNMRFPVQGVRMGPPNTPPPPYSAHIPNPNLVNRPRLTLDKTKGNQLSDKERAFEEQRQKLRMFGKPGMTKVDPDALIGSMFAVDTKKKVQQNKKHNVTEQSKEEDDSFGDFLQGPAVQNESVIIPDEKPSDFNNSEHISELYHEPVQQKGKKDLDSMMMEFSDLNAPKKAKGFHKPTLNEVQKHNQHPQKTKAMSFHDSDHARSWKQQCDDLTGLFQMPEEAKVHQPVHPPTSPPAVISSEHVPSSMQLPAELAQMHSISQQQIEPGLPNCSNEQISTERLYPILLMSGLPREKLAHIWSLCNTGTPGQLVKNELWAVLALISLTQNNLNTTTLDTLSRFSEPPVPMFAATQGVALPAPTAPAQPKPIGAAASEEDDFADFQAAFVPPQQHVQHKVVSVHLQQHHNRQNTEIYFTHNQLQLQEQPYQQHQQHQQQQHHQQQQQQQEQLQNELESVSHSGAPVIDDKYGNNVRSFFCSSGSSTGHTSPSFEEDYYTDGRDSLSQISTSEQSENEDIRNFENYVEEFNSQKQQPPSASPLHCPFPSLQQPPAAPNTAPVRDIPPVPFNPGGSKASSFTVLPGLANQRNNNNLSLSASETSLPPILNSPHGKLQGSTTQSFPNLSAAEDDSDFSDFKSAALTANPASSDPNEVNLIKEEDKYDALRAFSVQGNEGLQTSTFDQAPKADHCSTADPGLVEAEVEDDWADFTTAPTVEETSVTASNLQLPAAPVSGPVKASKDDILTLFNKTDTLKPGESFFSSSSSNVAMDFPNKNAPAEGLAGEANQFETSLFDSTSSSDSLHTIKKPQFNYGAVSFPPGIPVSSSSSTSTPSTLGGGLFQDVSNPEQFTSVFGSSTAVTDSVAEDWGKYSSSSVSTSNPLEVVHFPALESNVEKDDWGDFSATTTMEAPASVGTKGEEDWCDFNAHTETEDAASQEPDSNFVTIKKQNLGTSEILGLFKVRDDPTTLSSYQLPQQQLQPTSKPRAKSQPSVDDDDGFSPPPMDFENDDDEEDLTFSRGYDLDDVMQQQVPATTYSVYGHSMNSAVYTQARTKKVLKETKEESGSVHSLELRPTSHIGDCSGSDSHSMSSIDGHSKSTDSLDQKGNPPESSEGRTAKEESIQPAQAIHHPIEPHELLASMPDFGDKYNIENEAQGSDRYGYEWTRCLLNCCQVITEANTLFNTISSSSVCNEVLKSNQGSQYIASIVEIYRVVCRVMTSMRSTAISTTELEQTLKNIDLAWNNLTAFLVGVSLLPDQSTLVFDNCVLKSDSEPSKNLACGLCLLNVDISPAKTLIQSAPSGSSKLTYAGRQYHSTCANFWVNCVDQTLPSLTLPELL